MYLSAVNLFRTVTFEDTDKYPSIFSCQMEAIVIIIRQLFFATRAVLKIKEYQSYIPQFRGMFVRVILLDQSPASENIWWIIKMFIVVKTKEGCYFAREINIMM